MVRSFISNQTKANPGRRQLTSSNPFFAKSLRDPTARLHHLIERYNRFDRKAAGMTEQSGSKRWNLEK